MPKRSANKVEEYLNREAKCLDDVSDSTDDSDDDIKSTTSVEIKKKKSAKRNIKNKKSTQSGKFCFIIKNIILLKLFF